MRIFKAFSNHNCNQRTYINSLWQEKSFKSLKSVIKVFVSMTQTTESKQTEQRNKREIILLYLFGIINAHKIPSMKSASKNERRRHIKCNAVHSKVSLFIWWWCLITWSLSPHSFHTMHFHLLCSSTSSRRDYRECICGYNNKIVNLRSHVIKAPTRREKNSSSGIYCNNGEVMQRQIFLWCKLSPSISISLSLHSPGFKSYFLCA